MKKRRRAFTLIEVLAALGLIIVLTLTLVVTIKTQVDQANARQLQSLVATVNARIEIAYSQTGRNEADFASTASLVRAGIITQDQVDQLDAASYRPHTFTAP